MTTPPRVFVPFFIASLVLTLTWGATLGMINLARLTAGWGLGVLPRPSVWAHGYVQVFGFMALFIMGVAYHVLPRFVGGALQHARLVSWSFWLQLCGVVADRMRVLPRRGVDAAALDRWQRIATRGRRDVLFGHPEHHAIRCSHA